MRVGVPTTAADAACWVTVTAAAVRMRLSPAPAMRRSRCTGGREWVMAVPPEIRWLLEGDVVEVVGVAAGVGLDVERGARQGPAPRHGCGAGELGPAARVDRCRR